MTSKQDTESVDYEKLSDLLKANSELTKDVCMLKQLVYCLNSQLGRYQKLYFLNQKSPSHPKKIPTNVIPPLPEGFGSSETLERYLQNATKKGPKVSKFERPPEEKIVSFKEKNAKEESGNPQLGAEEGKMFGKIPKKSDSVGSRLGNWDLLTLSPLLDAYEETIKEKDDIIKSYEQKMLALGQKCREVVLENEALYEEREKLLCKDKDNLGKNAEVDDQNLFLEEQNKLLKEYLDLEKEKFIEVHEIYEGKITELTEELNRVREEQRQCLAELSDARGRCGFLEGEAARLRHIIEEESIPMSVHNESIEECKRLLEELRMQYERDNMNTLTKLKEIERAKMKLMSEVAELTDLKDKSDKLLRTKEHLLRRSKEKCIQVCVRLTKAERRNELLRDNLRRAVSLLEEISVDSYWSRGEQPSLEDEHAMQQRLLVVHAALQTFQQEARKELDSIARKLRRRRRSRATTDGDTAAG